MTNLKQKMQMAYDQMIFHANNSWANSKSPDVKTCGLSDYWAAKAEAYEASADMLNWTLSSEGIIKTSVTTRRKERIEEFRAETQDDLKEAFDYSPYNDEL